MAIRVAINGFGRIGRCIFRSIFENSRTNEFQIVAINSLGDADIHSHLLQYDTTHGRFNFDVSHTEDTIECDGKSVILLCERDPSKLPWEKLDIDIVFECTGAFASKTKSQGHIRAGAKKVLISAPAGNDVDATIVYGVNHNTLSSNDLIVSNASCTTNCLAPLVKPLHEELGLKSGLMTTIHSYTNDQVLSDVYHSDLRRARAAAHSMIPTNTGAATAVGLVLPELVGKLDGFAMRVPTLNVSVVDLTFTAGRDTSVAEVNSIVENAASGDLKGILEINDLPLVSCDFNHNPASSIFDKTQTRVIGNLVKILSWYDNEWGFSNRMLDTATAMMRV
ncbi:MAG: type I glyceraldehyde-3-phosphate dehydrogenase [Francisellaceae bacterium]|jgi:glyceraldehyde 3-phosphate dehydrogenase|nr:type I glyceraldehyde-3-phosphate dehydrogenase [Francisellaceae bacterium]MBT6207615.1 type I glyceraldehyde-3-phosphate dehydrogenase [Francisellaceae bacterium]MBT6538427.1 type I glyceraldehyde-3-phosphate dehydrogenase [Francisellaceae bacterium]